MGDPVIKIGGVWCVHSALLLGVAFYFVAWHVSGKWGRPRLSYGVVP